MHVIIYTISVVSYTNSESMSLIPHIPSHHNDIITVYTLILTIGYFANFYTFEYS